MALLDSATLTQTLGVGDLYPEPVVNQIVEAANALVLSYIDADAASDEPPACKEAALAIAVEMWQSRLAPGGQMVGVDFTPAPFRMGRSLILKVTGLLAPYLNEEGLVG